MVQKPTEIWLIAQISQSDFLTAPTAQDPPRHVRALGKFVPRAMPDVRRGGGKLYREGAEDNAIPRWSAVSVRPARLRGRRRDSFSIASTKKGWLYQIRSPALRNARMPNASVTSATSVVERTPARPTRHYPRVEGVVFTTESRRSRSSPVGKPTDLLTGERWFVVAAVVVPVVVAAPLGRLTRYAPPSPARAAPARSRESNAPASSPSRFDSVHRRPVAGRTAGRRPHSPRTAHPSRPR